MTGAPRISAPDVALRLGLRKYPRSWRGRCPVCNYSGNTFSVRSKNGWPKLYCSNGCSHDELNTAMQAVFAGTWQPSERNVESEAEARERKHQAALKLWNGAEPLRRMPADPAVLYLQRRGIGHLSGSSALRYRRDVSHPEQKRHPAMVALVQAVDDRPLGVHRTYVTQCGEKANVEPAKASLGTVWGGAIRLDPAGPEIVIGEGIESSASAGKLLGLPAWAAISAGNLARGLVLPLEVRSVVIAADADMFGERAARDGALRWQREGRRVRIARPDESGTDFNDLLRECAHA